MENISLEAIVILAVVGIWLVMQVKNFIQAPDRVKQLAIDIAKEVQRDYVDSPENEKLKILIDRVHAELPKSIQRYLTKTIMTAIVKDAFREVIQMAEEDLTEN